MIYPFKDIIGDSARHERSPGLEDRRSQLLSYFQDGHAVFFLQEESRSFVLWAFPSKTIRR